jgi:hypothetical protein
VPFAVLIWPIFTPELQRQTTSELAHIAGRLNRKTLAGLKFSLVSLPIEDWDAIAGELQTRPAAMVPGWVKALDLAAKSPT